VCGVIMLQSVWRSLRVSIFKSLLTNGLVLADYCFHMVTGLCYQCLWQFCHSRDSRWLDWKV